MLVSRDVFVAFAFAFPGKDADADEGGGAEMEVFGPYRISDTVSVQYDLTFWPDVTFRGKAEVISTGTVVKSASCWTGGNVPRDKYPPKPVESFCGVRARAMENVGESRRP